SAEDLPALRYRLGLALYEQGKEPKKAIELMAAGVDKGADRPGPAYGLLARAYLALPNPNIEAALEASQKQLELIDDRDMEETASARLLRGKLLLFKGQRHEALNELALIESGAPRGQRLEARLLQ